jgi:DNA-binding transcriptional MerR regulator
MESASMNETGAPTYRSGAAARLAGIQVATLRMWERRYCVVGPRTSDSGHRRYGAEDVRRLALIKSLVDQGHAIGTLAHLPIDALRAMGVASASRTRTPPTHAAGQLRVALVGEALVARAQASAERFPSLQIVAACADRAEAAVRLAGIAIDLLAVELPALREDAAAWVETVAATAGARRAVVAYRFATEAAVDTLRQHGHAVLHAPIGLDEVVSLAGIDAGAEPPPRAGPPPAPRFDESVLAQLAQIATAVRCECPRNVVELLLSLGAFERYSAECENRSPADAELHRYLGQVSGRARAMFEDALVRVARAEGIALPQPPSAPGAP